VKIDLCIVSCRRPQGLLRLLGALQELALPEPAPELRVVVVDNDPEGSAREICAEAAGWLRFPLLYLVEKRRGIPQARNSALAAALERADFAAFLDDDEVPEPGWLGELLRVQAARGADAVAGPCLPLFEAPPPRWLERGRLFDLPRHATGARLATAYSGNVLVATRALSQMDRLFDERMALLGGSDDEFFRRFAARGHRIVWADGARVHEWVPPARATAGWILRRGFRVGSCETFLERRLSQPPRPAPLCLAHALWCLAKGTLRAAWMLPRGRGAALRELRLAATGAGRLAGLFGFFYQEYR
jgi:glycosyltransferase involved in cell wall biosynthesis